MPASEPYYRQIMADIRARIASGDWPPGHQLLSTEKLVEHYAQMLDNPNLSAGTVRQAVTILIETGELRGQQGKAVYVVGRDDGKTED